MKNNKIFAILIFLIIAGFLIAGYGMYYMGKNSKTIFMQDKENNLSKEVQNNIIKNNETNNESSPVIQNDLKIYKNDQYGFSFEYPDNWNLNEDKSKNEVTIHTNDDPLLVEDHAFHSWSITFKATDKTFFDKTISTKIGIIKYDEKLSALVSDSCLKVGKLFGNVEGNNTSIQSIIYGGSLMSDPAYSNSAILTNNGRIIIVNSQQGTAITPQLSEQLSIIANSFKLLNNNTVFVPDCSK